MALGEPGQHVEIAGNQRRFGDDAERKPTKPQQRLEQSPGQQELALRRLVGIGGRSDDQLGAGELFRLEGAEQYVRSGMFDEDLVLERFPRGERATRGGARATRLGQLRGCDG